MFEGVTRKTSLVIMDGAVNTTESKTSAMFLPATPYSHILNVLIRDLGLPAGIVIPPKGGPLSPAMLDGNTMKLLSDLATDTRSICSIQDMRVNFVPRFSVELLPFKVIDSSSGLVGSPAALGDSTGTPAKDTSTVTKGVKFKVLLDASLVPDTLITLESREFSGVFRIQKVRHTGNFRGKDWYTDCEATQIEDVVVDTAFAASRF